MRTYLAFYYRFIDYLVKKPTISTRPAPTLTTALTTKPVISVITTVITTVIATIAASLIATSSVSAKPQSLSLPLEGDMATIGTLYHNPSGKPIDRDHPEASLYQLDTLKTIDLKGGDYWLHFPIYNPSATTSWSININGSFIEHVQGYLFEQASGTNTNLSTLLSSNQSGQFDPPSYLHHYGMDFLLKENHHYDLWINLQSAYFTAPPHLQVMPTNEFRNSVNARNILIISCLGSIVILALYNFLIFLWTRAKEYLFYSAYLVSTFLGWAAVFGIFSPFFDSTSIALIMIPFYFNIIFNIFFYQYFLELPKHQPWLSKLSYGIVGLTVILMALYTFTPAWINYVFINITNSLWLVTGLICGLVRLRQGYKPARFFVLGFSSVFIGGAFIILPYSGVTSTTNNGYLIALVGQTLDVLFLALALAERINNLQKDKEVALKLAHNTSLIANKTLTKANTKLHEALDIAAKNQRQKDGFLIAVSHELRTPLNTIAVSLSQLQQTNNPEKQQQLQQYIQFGTERLTAQVENIVILAELDEKDIVPQESSFSALELFDELEEMALGYIAEKDIHFHCYKTRAVSEYYRGDKHLLSRLLAPIIDNACKYTVAGDVKLLADYRWGNLIFEIIDSGPGLPANKQDGIFDSFVQISEGYQRNNEGLGLGLAICKRLSKILDATIEFDAVIPHGCHCIVTVPMRKQEYTPPSLQRNAGSTHVLVVEDNQINAKVLQIQLSNLGVTSDIAENGILALERTNNVNYDLIFMDLQMPKMNGFDATEAIRLKGISVPIIAVTANSDYKSRKRCTEVGIDEFLTKPIKKKEVQQTIKKWLR